MTWRSTSFRFRSEAVKARAVAAANTIDRLIGFSQEVIETMRKAGARGTVHDLAVNIVSIPIGSRERPRSRGREHNRPAHRVFPRGNRNDAEGGGARHRP